VPRVRDAAISHAVDLSAYANSVVADILRILDATDKGLFEELYAALAEHLFTEFSMKRLMELLRSIRSVNAEAYRSVMARLDGELVSLAVHEAGFSTRLIAGSPISNAQAYAAGNSKPLLGRLMKDWALSLAQSRMQRIQDNLAMGYMRGATVAEMIKQLRGTRAAGYSDGLLGVDRRHAEAIVRTAIGHYAQAAREEVYKANKDIIQSVMWLSTLDTRTSEICQLRDGLHYTLDGKPVGHKIEWLGGPGNAHWNCRSTAIPDLPDMFDSQGTRVRASMDGPVSAKVTYAEWLEKQPAERQREILGPNRAKLMREGKYTLSKFYNNKGRHLTLDELRASDEKTFKRLDM